MRFASEGEQIDSQHAEHAGDKDDPEPEIRVQLITIELR